jgi:hypothetical protein
MGTRVEFNNVIALDHWSYRARVEDVVPPYDELAVGWGHPFRKQGHRIYALDQQMPLLETDSYPIFKRLLAYVQLKYYGVKMTPTGVETFGEYIIKRVVSEEESKQWLALHNPKL